MQARVCPFDAFPMPQRAAAVSGQEATIYIGVMSRVQVVSERLTTLLSCPVIRAVGVAPSHCRGACGLELGVLVTDLVTSNRADLFRLKLDAVGSSRDQGGTPDASELGVRATWGSGWASGGQAVRFGFAPTTRPLRSGGSSTWHSPDHAPAGGQRVVHRNRACRVCPSAGA